MLSTVSRCICHLLLSLPWRTCIQKRLLSDTPLEDGDIELLEDPFWNSRDPLAGLGRLGVHRAEAGQNDRDLWERRAGQHRYEICQQIEARGHASVVDEAQAPEMGSRSERPVRKSKHTVKEESFENQDIEIDSSYQLPRSIQSSAAIPRQSAPNQHPLSNDRVLEEVSDQPSSRQYMTSGQLISQYLARQQTSTDQGRQFKSWLQPHPSRSRQYSTAPPFPRLPRSPKREEKHGTKQARERSASPSSSEHFLGNASICTTYGRGERRNKEVRTRPVLNLAHHFVADSFSD